MEDRCDRDMPGECEGTYPDGHYHTVHAQSGEYHVVADETGTIIRDDRPWQMTSS